MSGAEQAKVFKVLQQSASYGCKSLMNDRLSTSIPGSKPEQSASLSEKVTSVGERVGPGTLQTLIKSCICSRVRRGRVDSFLGMSCREGSCTFLVCKPVWAISFVCAKLPALWLLLSAVQYLGTHNLDPTKVNLTAAASRWYLAVRLDNKDLINGNDNSKECDSIPKLLSSLARICIIFYLLANTFLSHNFPSFGSLLAYERSEIDRDRVFCVLPSVHDIGLT